MIQQLLLRKKDITLERTYAAPLDKVWEAWTQPELLRQWWGPPKTSIVECEVDLRVDGRLRIVMEAGEEMGKYAGTRWPMAGTFTVVDGPGRMAYDARSWTDGDEDTTFIEHANEVTLTADGAATIVRLRIAISDIGGSAKLAAFGMKFGYKAQLEKLDTLLAS